jgi:hypothetical protein
MPPPLPSACQEGCTQPHAAREGVTQLPFEAEATRLTHTARLKQRWAASSWV